MQRFCFRPFRFRRAARLLLLATGCVPFAAPLAAVRCIDSDVQVAPMFDAALASAEALEEIRIKQGNYFFTSGEIGYFGVIQGSNKTLLVSGGWSGAAGQCSSRDGGASTTLFWGLGQRRVFSLAGSTTFTGTVVIENMSFGGGYTANGSVPSCLQLGAQNGGSVALRLDRVRVEACTTAPGLTAPAAALSADTGVIVRNSLFANNDGGGSPVLTVSNQGGIGFVLNNTIADNVSGNINGFVGLSASAAAGSSLTLGNNLFDRNVATAAPRVDLRVANGVTLINNRFRGLFGTPVQNLGSSTGAGGFGENDYELARDSSARDAGALFAPILQGTQDLAGRARVVGGAVDLGALEHLPLLQNGFE